MNDPLSRSSRYIDTGVLDGPVDELSLALSEVGDGIAMIDGFSHVIAVQTTDGIVQFDTSMPMFAPRAVEARRAWSADPVHTLVYTHGHVDHVGGASHLLDDATAHGERRPAVVAHEGVPKRFARYDRTSGYNAWINHRQFGGTGLTGQADDAPPAFWNRWVQPSVTFDDDLSLRVGDTDFVLHHGRGETDDHAWIWLPEQKAAVVGDFMIWVFPNAGNPQKVQRYPLEWAQTLRRIAAYEPDLLLPAHGLPVEGADRIQLVLGDVAGVLELVVGETLRLMNDGAPLDEIIHSVRVPPEELAKPWLRPVYDEPEFVVRNVWRMYGGWYDGNPSRLKPAADAALATETARLAGGVPVLVARARELSAAGDEDSVSLACHLVEAAVLADPDDVDAHAARADVYSARRHTELSLMAKGIYGHAARASAAKVTS